MQVSGGIIRGTPRERKHTEQYYEAIRKRRTDFLLISKNTGFSIEQVQAIKNHIFYNKHYLEGNTISERFHPSYEMAESWRRLSERGGKNIQPRDVLLLHHELYEIQLLLSDYRMSQKTAHALASKKYPYVMESEKFYRLRGQ